jgi:hypothetical protein
MKETNRQKKRGGELVLLGHHDTETSRGKKGEAGRAAR